MSWYTLQTNAGKEALVAQQLEARDLTVFFPRLHVRPVNPRSRTERAFFPGYIFVQAQIERVGQLLFQYLPHAVGLVRFNDVPATLDADLVDGLRARIDQINASGGERTSLRHGDTVIIDRGPFAGYEAMFDVQLHDSDRVRVLLDLLGNRQVTLSLELGHIRPKR